MGIKMHNLTLNSKLGKTLNWLKLTVITVFR
jgi:hypothetical protein